MIFLDVEASGLHAASYPIEVGWVTADLTAGWSALIRPAPIWGEDGWNAESEKVHGIPHDRLVESGIPCTDSAARLNSDLRDLDVLTDNPAMDSQWLWRLFDAAGVEPTFPLMSPAAATETWRRNVVGWGSRQVLVDAYSLITAAAGRAKIAADEHELLTASLNAEAGIVPHRAIDDAVAHALSLGAVALLDLARKDGDAAARLPRADLVARARRILAKHGRAQAND